MASGILAPLDFFAPDDPIAEAIDASLERDGFLFFGLPRFDGWGTPPSIDPQYAIGYLLRALRIGRRETFWTGLLGMVGHGMDPTNHTFREVGPIAAPGAPVPAPPTLPLLRLDQSEPCVGPVGVVLQLVRHALVSEWPGPGRHLRLLGGMLPDWWRERVALEHAPTSAGPVSLHVEPDGTTVRVTVDAPGAAVLDIVDPHGHVHRRPGGRHSLRFDFARYE